MKKQINKQPNNISLQKGQREAITGSKNTIVTTKELQLTVTVGYKEM